MYFELVGNYIENSKLMKRKVIIILIVGLYILLLTVCEGVLITPEVNNVNSGDQSNMSNIQDDEVVEGGTTKPVITGTRSPLPNASGWNNTDVIVTFICEEAEQSSPVS